MATRGWKLEAICGGGSSEDSIVLPDLANASDIDDFIRKAKEVDPPLYARIKGCVNEEGKVIYPLRGQPAPYGPKICHHRDESCGHDEDCTACICGVGGHTEKIHESVSTKLDTVSQAFRQGSWIIREMDQLLPHEVAKQCEVLVIVLCAMRLAVYRHAQEGYDTDPKFVGTVLSFYRSVKNLVQEKHPSIAFEGHASMQVPDSNPERQFRTGTVVLGSMLAFCVDPLDLESIPSKVFVTDETRSVARVCLFPESTSEEDLQEWCDLAFGSDFREEDLDAMVARPLGSVFAACKKCRLPSHNSRKCKTMSQGLRVALTLTTLCDPAKQHRLVGYTPATILFKSYALIIQMLYEGWKAGGVWGEDFELRGDNRLKVPSGLHPAMALMRLFNHVLINTKMDKDQDNRLMVCLGVEDLPLVPLAHLNEGLTECVKTDKKRKRSEIRALQRDASRKAADEEVDDDAPSTPRARRATRTLLTMSISQGGDEEVLASIGQMLENVFGDDEQAWDKDM